MPLRDHFRSPLSDQVSWEGLHGMWPALIAFRLNDLLPAGFRCGPRVHHPLTADDPDGGADVYEMRVYDESRGPTLVAAVALVSPSNKDRPESREAFVAKSHALLRQGVCLAVVDVVTERSTNPYAELADRLGADPPAVSGPIYAVCCRGRTVRGRWRVEAWAHELAVGGPLPTLPLWLTGTLRVPLELEATYEDTCRGLRIP